MNNIEVKKCTVVTDSEGNRLLLYGSEAEDLMAAMLDEFSPEELQNMRNRANCAYYLKAEIGQSN